MRGGKQFEVFFSQVVQLSRLTKQENMYYMYILLNDGKISNCNLFFHNRIIYTIVTDINDYINNKICSAEYSNIYKMPFA